MTFQLQKIEQLNASERLKWAAEVATRLGAEWQPKEVWPFDSLGLYNLRLHRTFALIPGGQFMMGLTHADAAYAGLIADWSEEVEEWFYEHRAEASMPVHNVTVRPFLCATSLETGAQGEPLIVDRVDARSVAQRLDCRLPSEAELEWIARQGGTCSFTLNSELAARDDEVRSRFGIEQFMFGQWAEDDWHDNYEQAPSTSDPWMNGEPMGVTRSGVSLNLLMINEDILDNLAALRWRGAPGRFCVRLVVPLHGDWSPLT